MSMVSFLTIFNTKYACYIQNSKFELIVQMLHSSEAHRTKQRWCIVLDGTRNCR